MHRRQFLASSATLAAALAVRPSHARQSIPAASGFPRLEIALTDEGFELPESMSAGRHEAVVTNTGTMTESHWAMGKFPDEVTEAEIEAFFAAQGEDTEALAFDDIAFVGVPDWPQPGGPAVTGVIDLQPGRYIAFKPVSDAVPVRFTVEGGFPAVEEPASDLTVDLRDMAITLPETAFATAPVRWKIENTGSLHHDVAVVPVPADFTEDHFMTIMSLPWEATPPPGVPAFEYLPVAAIGILAAGGTSWLDVQLEPGRYLAVCMLPFGTGYPHAMDGMYVFFDVA